MTKPSSPHPVKAGQKKQSRVTQQIGSLLVHWLLGMDSGLYLLGHAVLALGQQGFKQVSFQCYLFLSLDVLWRV